MKKLTTAIDKKLLTIGVFIDLKKAFDTIDHSLLLKKLEFYGIRGIASEWLNSYLCNRSQFVSLNGVNSDLQKVLCGVPQGSILGPKLFIIYINDICNTSSVLNFILFADDTNSFCTGKDIVSLSTIVSKELVTLNTWFAINKLSLNVAKTNFMVFGNLKFSSKFNISINNHEIDRVYSTKFLGVIIDHKLNWKDHVANVKSKLHKSLSIMYKVKNFLSECTLKLLYSALLLPYLNYCSEVWGKCCSTVLAPIVILQKRAIRIICKSSNRAHTTLLFKKLELLKFVDIIDFKIGVIMYKANHKLLPRNIQLLFTFNIDNKYKTRQCNKLSVIFARTALKSRCLSIYGVKLWNSIEETVSTSITLIKFKKLFKTETY